MGSDDGGGGDGGADTDNGGGDGGGAGDGTTTETMLEVQRVERMVLADLYRVTEGSRWRRQGGWLSRQPHCSWEGVTCLGPDRPAGILSLSLPANGLAGTLPQTLARLHHLRNLDLSRNALRGTVSSAMGSMRRLRVLSLRSNAVSGRGLSSNHIRSVAARLAGSQPR